MAKKKDDENKKVFSDIEEKKTDDVIENFVQSTDENEDMLSQLNAKIEELEKEICAVKEAHIRTLAEYDNFRKRTQKEKEAIFSDSKIKILTELLGVADNFERASMNADTDFDGYRKGIEMTFQSFMGAFAKLGVEPFGKPGEQFDPNFHNAVMHTEDEALEENIITDVFSKGYKLGDKILRPAMVKVAN